jgi:hypothetical protein
VPLDVRALPFRRSELFQFEGELSRFKLKSGYLSLLFANKQAKGLYVLRHTQRNFTCPETDAPCVESRCTRNMCAIQETERSRRQEADAPKALRKLQLKRLRELFTDD